MKFRKNVLLPAAISSAVIFAPQAYALDSEVEREMQDVGQEVEQTYDEVAENSEESWDKTKHKSKQQWEETKEATAKTWEKVKDTSKKAMDSSEKMFKDGMIAGSLETALVLNKHINPFEINIEVENGDVLLSGEVDSEIDRELAINIAKGIEGVGNVKSEIKVVSEPADQEHAKASKSEEKGRKFSQYISDLTTTASIKTELLANDSISGLAINVDTNKDQVTLSGEVKSSAQKSLAEAIVKKRDDVTRVVNKLTVRS